MKTNFTIRYYLQGDIIKRYKSLKVGLNFKLKTFETEMEAQKACDRLIKENNKYCDLHVIKNIPPESMKVGDKWEEIRI